MKAQELREQFIKETGKGCEIPDFKGQPVTFTQYYVEWLERKLIEKEIRKTRLTEKILNKHGFFIINYGYERKINPGKILRLIVSDGGFFPQIEVYPVLSTEDIQIVVIYYRIEYLNQLQELWSVLTGEKLK